MSLQPNPSFKDDFEEYSVQVSLECLWLDRGMRVQEGSKNSRRERGKKSKIKGNSKGLIVGRKEREGERERQSKKKIQNVKRGYLRSTLIYLYAVPSFSHIISSIFFPRQGKPVVYLSR